MTRKITLLLTLLVFGLSGIAQVSFDVDSSDLIYVDMTNFDYSVKTQITNNSTDPADTLFTWERIIEDLPDTWETAICDKDLCYPVTTSTSGFVLLIGQTVDFKVNYYAYGTKDCGNATLTIRSNLNPTTNNDTFYSEVCTFNPVSVKQVQNSFKVYPNPAKDYLTVKSSDQGVLEVGIYDILGNLVMSENVLSGNNINIQNLVPGVYIARIEGDYTSSQVFNKQ
jgi:hypothetical protein